MIYISTKIIQSWLYPATCVLCGAPGDADLDLCRGCRQDAPLNQHACRRCALPLNAPLPAHGLCGNCLRQPPPYHAGFALLRYSSPASDLIRDLKFHARLENARLLGSWMADTIVARSAPLPQLLIPVPLHRSRQRQRGFNQALELARPLARRLHIPIDARLARRLRNTAAQTELNAAARRANVRHAFALSAALPVRHVAIVDDVVTTGHTVAELAALLQRHGAQVIEVWCAARAAP